MNDDDKRVTMITNLCYILKNFLHYWADVDNKLLHFKGPTLCVDKTGFLRPSHNYVYSYICTVVFGKFSIKNFHQWCDSYVQ